MRKALTVLGVLLGLYLVVRAIAEPFVIDMSDPATYRDDWGGPSLVGVLLVHMGPGAAAAVVGVVLWRRWRVRRRPLSPTVRVHDRVLGGWRVIDFSGICL